MEIANSCTPLLKHQPQMTQQPAPDKDSFKQYYKTQLNTWIESLEISEEIKNKMIYGDTKKETMDFSTDNNQEESEEDKHIYEFLSHFHPTEKGIKFKDTYQYETNEEEVQLPKKIKTLPKWFDPEKRTFKSESNDFYTQRAQTKYDQF